MSNDATLDDAILQQAISNWTPRFIANGTDWLDVRAAIDGLTSWAAWPDGWCRVAERYGRLAGDAAAAGHRVTQADFLRRAALLYNLAALIVFHDDDRLLALRKKSVACYAAAAPHFEPPVIGPQRLQPP